MRSVRISLALGVGPSVVLVIGVIAVADTADGGLSAPSIEQSTTPLANGRQRRRPGSRLVTSARTACRAARPARSLARIFAMAREVNRAGRPSSATDRFPTRCFAKPGQTRPANNTGVFAGGRDAERDSRRALVSTGGGRPRIYDAGDRSRCKPGYAFMKQVAVFAGWTHPAFAEPGGQLVSRTMPLGVGRHGGNPGVTSARRGFRLLPSPDDGGYATIDGLGGRHEPTENFVKPRLGDGRSRSRGDGGCGLGTRDVRLRDGRRTTGGLASALRTSMVDVGTAPTNGQRAHADAVGKGYWLLPIGTGESSAAATPRSSVRRAPCT